jgi:hypothetical protein
MINKITYNEPIPQFDENGAPLPPKIEQITVIAHNQVEYDIHMIAITNPEREIIVTSETGWIDDINELKAWLSELDSESARPLGTMAYCDIKGLPHDPYDEQHIIDIETEKNEIRDKIRTLELHNTS